MDDSRSLRSRIACAILWLVLATMPTGASADPEPSLAGVRDAMALGQWTLAEAELDMLLASSPSAEVEAEGRYLRAVMTRARGEAEMALVDVRAVERLGPPLGIHRDALFLEGELLYELGRHEASAAAFRRFVAVAPEDARFDLARWYHAEAMARIDRCDVALGVYESLIAAGATTKELRQRARFGRAWCRRQGGDEAGALDDFSASAEGSDVFIAARARFEAGASAFRLGRYADTVDWLEGRLGTPVEGEAGRLERMLGQSLFAMGENDAASVHLERALGLVEPGEHPKILYQLGWIDLDAGRERAANGRFAQLLGMRLVVDSLRVAAEYGLGLSFVRGDSLSAAIGPLERVRQSRDRTWGDDARYALAFVYNKLGDYPRSQRAIQELESLYPASPLLADADLVQGENLYKAHRYEEALALYERQLARGEGDDADVLYRLSITQLKLGRTDDAVDSLKRLLLRHPTSPHRVDARFWLAEAHFRAGRTGEARREYEAVRLAAPEESVRRLDAIYGIGWCDYSEGRYAEAAATFTRLLDRHGGAGRADDLLLRRGNCLYNLRRFPEAIDDYDRLLVRYSQSRWAERALYQKAWSLHRIERFDEARAAFESLESRYPDSDLVPDALYRAAHALFRAGRHVEAAERFSRVALHVEAADSLRTHARVRMAESYFNAKDYDRAATAYQALTADSYPEELRETAYDGWIRSLEAAGRTADAEDVVAKMSQRLPDASASGEALYRIGVRYLDAGKNEEGVAALRRYLEAGAPEAFRVDANRRAAEATLALGDKLRAAEFYRNAAYHGDVRDGIEYRFEAGRLFYEIGRFQLARDEFRRVIRLEPESETRLLALYNLGLALKETGEMEEALDAFGEVAKAKGTKKSLRADALLETGLAYRQLGRHADSHEPLCAAAQAGEGSTGAEAQYWCAEVDFDAERYAQAIKGYRRIVESFPKEKEWGITSRYRLAECFEQLNHWARAREQYEAILTLASDDTWASDARERLEWMKQNSWVFEEKPIGDPSEWQ